MNWRSIIDGKEYKGTDLVKKNGKVYERYIDGVKVDGSEITIGKNYVAYISVLEEPNRPFKVTVTYDDESLEVFVNRPVTLYYGLKEARPIESEEE